MIKLSLILALLPFISLCLRTGLGGAAGLPLGGSQSKPGSEEEVTTNELIKQTRGFRKDSTVDETKREIRTKLLGEIEENIKGLKERLRRTQTLAEGKISRLSSIAGKVIPKMTAEVNRRLSHF